MACVSVQVSTLPGDGTRCVISSRTQWLGIRTVSPVQLVEPVRASPVQPVEPVRASPVQPVEPARAHPVQPVEPARAGPVQPVEPLPKTMSGADRSADQARTTKLKECSPRIPAKARLDAAEGTARCALRRASRPCRTSARLRGRHALTRVPLRAAQWLAGKVRDIPAIPGLGAAACIGGALDRRGSPGRASQRRPRRPSCLREIARPACGKPPRPGPCAPSDTRRCGPDRLNTWAEPFGIVHTGMLRRLRQQDREQERHGSLLASERIASVIDGSCGTETISKLSASPMPGTCAPASSLGGATSS